MQPFAPAKFSVGFTALHLSHFENKIQPSPKTAIFIYTRPKKDSRLDVGNRNINWKPEVSLGLQSNRCVDLLLDILRCTDLPSRTVGVRYRPDILNP